MRRLIVQIWSILPHRRSRVDEDSTENAFALPWVAPNQGVAPDPGVA